MKKLGKWICYTFCIIVLLVILTITGFSIYAGYFYDVPITSQYSFELKGEKEILEKYNIDFEQLFSENCDLMEMADMSHDIVSQIRQEPRLYCIYGTLEVADHKITDVVNIKYCYYVSHENYKKPAGHISIRASSLNSEEYSITGTFARRKSDISKLVVKEVLNGFTLDDAAVQKASQQIISLANGRYYFSLDHDGLSVFEE